MLAFWSTFVLGFLIVARLTRFINSDVLAEPIRNAVARRFGDDSKMAYLVECPWCASIWITAIVAPLAYWFGDHPAFLIAAIICGWSYAYGLIASNLDND